MTPLLAVSTQQKFALAVAAVLVAGWLVYLISAVARGPKPGSEIEQAPNRRPYLEDDAMEGPRLDRVLLSGLGLLLFVAIVFPLYWLHEPARQAGGGWDRGTKWFDDRAVEKGRELFETAPGSPPTPREPHFGCEGCHGKGGVGGVTVFSLTDPNHKDAPPRQVQWNCPPLNTVMLRFRPSEVTSIITYGRAGTPMPAWGVAGGGPMNDQQIEFLVAYLQSITITPDAARAQAAQYGTDGKALFENYCARCHTTGWSYGEPGVMGGGAYGPSLIQGATLRQFPNVDQQIEWVTSTADLGKQYGQRGVSSGRMPHFSDMLTAEQIRAIVDYERGL